jgi:plasmid stability protein
MARLTVRNAATEVVGAMGRRTVARGRSAETDHRDILRKASRGEEEGFAVRATALRQRLRSSVDSTEVIRQHRDRGVAE